MAYVPFTKLPQQFFDNLGNPLVNGTINAYLAGTSTPTNMFSDDTGTVAGASVTLDSRGEPTTFKLIWLDSTKNYKFILKDSTGATIWTIDNISADDRSDASIVDYTPAGAGSTATNVQAKLREIVSVKDFGAIGDGIIDDTVAIQAAITYAESVNAVVNFPIGTYDIKMIFITTGGIQLIGNGSTIVQNHDNVNSVTVGGAGQYKVSSAFFIKRGAADVEITGFDFTTDDASFPALAAGFESYFASIGGQHFERVNIHDNRFRGGQRRALFTQAGQKLRFNNNVLEDNGITIHIGYLLNVYFYDASSDTSVKYSPLEVYVQNNILDEWTHGQATCLFLTGAHRFSVRDNKLINMNQSVALRALYIYSNDLGPYDAAGNALSYIEGEVCGNQVEGTFDVGIEISGNSSSATATWDNSYRMNVQVTDNVVRGTGNGIKLNKVRGTKVTGNYVTVSKSPLFFNSEMKEVAVVNNYFECTSAGQTQITVYAGWAAGATDLTFNGNKVVSPTGDQYAFRSPSSVNLTGLTMNDNYWDFNSTVASCRPITLTLGGKSEIANNKFDVDTTTASVFLMVLNGNSQAGSLNVRANALVSATNTGATTIKFASIENFKDARITENDTGGAIVVEDTLRTVIRDNTVVLPSANAVRGIFCDNTGYAQPALVNIHGNYVFQPSALTAPGIAIASNNDATNNTLSKVTMNKVEGNSGGALIQQTVQGVIETIGNTIVNAGAGGTGIGVTGSATNTAL